MPRVLGDEYPATGSLSADGDALHDAHREQEEGGADSDRGVGGKEADQQSGNGHQQDAEGEHAFAAPGIAEVGHHDAAERARDVSRGEDAEGLKLAQPVRQAGGKEQSADDRGEEYKNNEVVELERAAEGGERERSKLGSRLGSGRLDGWGLHGARWKCQISVP